MSERTYRLLIVDDEPEILRVLTRVFKDQYSITSTTDPLEAVGLLERESYDMLISDIDMPSLNGYELMSLARKVCPRAVRVLITGAGTMEGAIRAINEGEVHRYVPKPFTLPFIRQVVAEALARKDELDQLAAASQRVDRRRRIADELEDRHPGLTVFVRDTDGAYLLDPLATTRAAARLGLMPLLTLDE